MFTRRGKVLRVAVIALLVVMAMPAVSLAQGRGRGRGRRDFDRSDRKCEKFVNCHDARDGRWDGRGPRRRFEDRRFRRLRDRDFDDDDFRRFQRRRFRNRDFDDDNFRRLQRRRLILDQYRNDPYYDYNRYNQRGFNWTDLLYLFMQ